MDQQEGRRLTHEAMEHYKAGRLPDAQLICQSVLLELPKLGWAMQIMALIASARGDYNTAIELMRKAVTVRPRVAQFHNNLGEIYWKVGRLKEASTCYRTAL